VTSAQSFVLVIGLLLIGLSAWENWGTQLRSIL
jgi:hypothetical protein